MAVAAVALTANAVDFDWSYLVMPEEGPVTEIRDIYVMFENMYEININSKSGIVLSHDNEPVNITSYYYDGDNILYVEPTDALNAPGTYTLEIGKGSICGYLDDSYVDTEDLPNTITLTWTIKGAASDVDFTFTPSLSENEILAYFGELTLEFPNLTEVTYAGEGISLAFGDEAVTDFKVATDANKLTLTLDNAIENKSGEVMVGIAAGALTGTDAEGKTGSNAQEIKLAYKLAAPVMYDLTLAISTPKPNAAGEISAEKSLMSPMFVCEEKGLDVAEGTAANVTIKEVDGDFEASARLKKGFGLNQNFTYFSADFGKEPSYNGRYIITIEKGVFGTADWLTDPNYGRSNDNIVLEFTYVDGLERESYTLEPESVTPEAGTYKTCGEISKVTLKFADAVEMKAGATAMLAGVDVNYREEAEFAADGDGFTVVFDPAPVEEGHYVLTVANGLFSAGNEKNAPVSIEYAVSFDTAVEGVHADEAESIYNLFGMPVGGSLKELPAGLYVINGKKVLVK